MALWLFRAGSSGEYENKFLDDNKVYLTWDGLKHDLSQLQEKRELYDFLLDFYSDAKMGAVRNWTGQIWPIAHRMEKGDWVILPSKRNPTIHIGEVKSEYKFHPNNEDPFFHSRDVDWFAKDIPRSNFDQDILYSLGAFMTVCRISRNDAEKRVREMAKNNWQPSLKHLAYKPSKNEGDSEADDTAANMDLEILAKDQIAKHLQAKYKGHGLTRLIEEILKAKGYITYRSSEGPDKGVDILAAPEPMGFGKPRLCVQVKSGTDQVDHPTLNQLIGTMQNFGAEQGLFVSWSGFKSSVNKEIPNQFFKVRLWSQNEIITELFRVYDKLDEGFKAELPFKRIWTLSLEGEDV